MSGKKTPAGTIKSFFSGYSRKRSPPTTGSSTEGGVSKGKKSAKVDDKDMDDIKADLLRDFDSEISDLNEEMEIVGSFEQNMEKAFRDFKDKIQASLKNVVNKLSEKIAALESRVKALESGDTNTGGGDKNFNIKVKKELNRQAQYAKKDHARMFGVPEQKGEDCRKVVCDIICKKLKIKIVPSDISVAHRVKKSKRQKHRPIIIRFKDRTQRFEILKERKLLKGSGISIAEDITIDNLNLIQEAEESELFAGVWFWNGKVFAKDKKNSKVVYTLDLFVNFEEIIQSKVNKDAAADGDS